MMLTSWLPIRGTNCMNPCAGSYSMKDKEEDQSDSWASWYPSADIYDTKENYVLKMDLPGVAKEDVNVEFKDSVLTVRGDRKENKEEKGDNYYSTESVRGKFYRAFRFPDNVDGHKIDATMKNGILELRVAKPEEIQPKNIPITVN